MSDSQEILFFAGGFVFFSIYAYVTYSASKRSGKSFIFLLLSHKRNEFLSKRETSVHYFSVGVAIATIIVTIVFYK